MKNTKQQDKALTTIITNVMDAIRKLNQNHKIEEYDVVEKKEFSKSIYTVAKFGEQARWNSSIDRTGWCGGNGSIITNDERAFNFIIEFDGRLTLKEVK